MGVPLNVSYRTWNVAAVKGLASLNGSPRGHPFNTLPRSHLVFIVRSSPPPSPPPASDDDAADRVPP